MDLNRKLILRRLDGVLAHYGEANENNEFDFQTDVDMVLLQMEIYGFGMQDYYSLCKYPY